MTWIDVVATARRLVDIAASRGTIEPDDAEHFLRLVLRFDQQLAQPACRSEDVSPS